MLINSSETQRILINSYDGDALQQIELLKNFKPGNYSGNITVLNDTAKNIVALTNNNYTDYDITVQNEFNFADTVNLTLAEMFQIKRSAERYGGSINLDYDNLSGNILAPRNTYIGQPGSVTFTFIVIPTAARVVSVDWTGVTIPRQTGITFTKSTSGVNSNPLYSSFQIRIDQSGATRESPYSGDIINDNTKLTINMNVFGIAFKYELSPFDLLLNDL